ncbi:MAG TPA: hypothetical protein PKA41_00495 [Verrucomicrobiota bacterium]|nr:hypothetical protein [Verrucomicrobiota bacterium]
MLTGIRSTLSLLALAAITAGCGRDEIKVYHVAKEQPAASPHSMQMPPGHPDISSSAPALPKIQWKLPQGWQEGRAGSMRAASFIIPGDNGQSADVAVIPLPPSGSDLDLVNMWRNQMQLPAVAAAAADKSATAVTVGGNKGKLYDIASETAVMDGGLRGRILVAMTHKDGLDWFFKMSGEDSLVASQRDTFLQFLESISFEPPSAASMASTDPHHGHVHSPGETHDHGASIAAGPVWTVPEAWQETSPGQFLHAKFLISGDDGTKADVNVSTSVGDGGGLAANVNRWLGQLGKSPWSAPELEKQKWVVPVAGGEAVFVEMSGIDARTGKPATVVGAIVPQAGQTWFYKLMGDEKLVLAQKEAFLGFVKGVKY